MLTHLVEPESLLMLPIPDRRHDESRKRRAVGREAAAGRAGAVKGGAGCREPAVPGDGGQEGVHRPGVELHVCVDRLVPNCLRASSVARPAVGRDEARQHESVVREASLQERSSARVNGQTLLSGKRQAPQREHLQIIGVGLLRALQSVPAASLRHAGDDESVRPARGWRRERTVREPRDVHSQSRSGIISLSHLASRLPATRPLSAVYRDQRVAGDPFADARACCASFRGTRAPCCPPASLLSSAWPAAPAAGFDPAPAGRLPPLGDLVGPACAVTASDRGGAPKAACPDVRLRSPCAVFGRLKDPTSRIPRCRAERFPWL